MKKDFPISEVVRYAFMFAWLISILIILVMALIPPDRVADNVNYEEFPSEMLRIIYEVGESAGVSESAMKAFLEDENRSLEFESQRVEAVGTGELGRLHVLIGNIIANPAKKDGSYLMKIEPLAMTSGRKLPKQLYVYGDIVDNPDVDVVDPSKKVMLVIEESSWNPAVIDDELFWLVSATDLTKVK